MSSKLSIITTVYNSENYLQEFLIQLGAVLEKLAFHHFEVIFVLDGITDNSKEILLEKKRNMPQIKIVELSRNFGHHQAISAGLKYSSGDLVFLIDCDLEVSPSVLADFTDLLKITKADVIYGVQHSRKGGFVERHLGGLFWTIFNYLSTTKLPLNTVTERLMKRSYVNALISMGDRNLFLAGMMHWIGYEQIPCTVNKIQREEPSTYTFRKRLSLVVEAITSFSEKPLKFVFCGGMVILFFAIVLSVIFLFRMFIYPETVLVGFTSIIILMLFSLGCVLSASGLVGLYLSKVFNQVKNRPLYYVKDVY